MRDSRLSEIMHSVAKRVRADFEQSRTFEHRGEAGAVRERILEEFVSKYLPGHLRAANSAEIITVSGEISPQCDVAIFDRSTPPLLDMESYRKLPSECVYGVIEVKSKLDKTQLTDACGKIARVKALPKTAFYPNPGPYASRTVYGKDYPYCPTAGMVFAYGGSDLKTLGRHLLDWCEQREVELWPDSVWVLGGGYLVWLNPEDGRVEPAPMRGASLAVVHPGEAEDVLFPFVTHLALHFTTAWMPPLRLIDYARNDAMGTIAAVLRQPS